MDMYQLIVEQLGKMGVIPETLSEIRTKDGIAVYRVKNKGKSYVYKVFKKEGDRREIDNYLLLNELSIKTVELVAYTDSAILLEDIDASEKYRLAESKDLNDKKVCKALAHWYKELHTKGVEYVKEHGSGMYMETDCITRENLAIIKERSHSENNPAWVLIEDNFETLELMLERAEKTLVYNDFYYGNLIVSYDKSEAFMFDYNLLGKGMAVSDIRNLELGKRGKRAFLKEYGEYDKTWEMLDELTQDIYSLWVAFKQDIFPEWANDVVKRLNDGEIYILAKKLFII